MKKAIFTAVLFTVMMSCNDSNNSTSTPVDSTVQPIDTPVLIPIDTTVVVDTLKAI